MRAGVLLWMMLLRWFPSSWISLTVVFCDPPFIFFKLGSSKSFCLIWRSPFNFMLLSIFLIGGYCRLLFLFSSLFVIPLFGIDSTGSICFSGSTSFNFILNLFLGVATFDSGFGVLATELLAFEIKPLIEYSGECDGENGLLLPSWLRTSFTGGGTDLFLPLISCLVWTILIMPCSKYFLPTPFLSPELYVSVPEFLLATVFNCTFLGEVDFTKVAGPANLTFVDSLSVIYKFLVPLLFHPVIES